jgi:hypothetical protein
MLLHDNHNTVISVHSCTMTGIIPNIPKIVIPTIYNSLAAKKLHNHFCCLYWYKYLQWHTPEEGNVTVDKT